MLTDSEISQHFFGFDRQLFFFPSLMALTETPSIKEHIMISSRRYDLDWLRLIAFGILIYFHAAIIFVPGGLPLIQNMQLSEPMDWFVTFSSQFRLALLFMISGVGVAFARRRRNNRAFLIERSQRLLIPFVVGILVVVPLCVYFERLHLGDFNGSFTEFLPTVFTSGIYPSGNLSWHHFWFIAYLYIYCLLGIAIFTWFEGVSGQQFLDKVEGYFRGYRIYSFIGLLLAVELPLRVFFPGFRDLLHDWASFSHWFIMFLVGYVLSNRAALLDEIAKMRFASLMGSVIFTALYFAIFYDYGNPPLTRDDPDVLIKYPLYCLITMSMAWCCLLSCLGYAGRYLRFSNGALAYLNEAVYPLFILHLTVIAFIAYLVTPLTWSIAAKYFVITTSTIAICLLTYHLMIRPFNFMRLLFGVRPKANPEPVTAGREGIVE
jgi:glucan biosynthesis protein C